MKSRKTTLITGTAVLMQVCMASAVPISGLWNTGVNNGGATMGVDAAEFHYAVTMPSAAVNPANYNPANYTIRVVNTPGSWVANPVGARWIGPTLTTTVNEGAGVSDPDNNSVPYIYSLSFSLAGLNPDTAVIAGKWASDNGSTIWLNGVNTGLSVAGFGSLTGFTVSDGMAGGTVQFLPGMNTLEFRVINNVQASGNPSGLLVSEIAGSALVPEGGLTLAMLCMGVAGLGLLRRKA